MVEDQVHVAIDEDGTEVNRDVQRLLGRGEIRSRGTTEGPYEITTPKTDGRERTVRPPFGREHLDRCGAVIDDDEVGARSGPLAPVGTPLDTHGACTEPRGPRRRDGWHRRRGGRAAVAGSVAFAASCPSRSVSCLMLRTKSPAVISSLRPSNTLSDSPPPNCGLTGANPGRVIESRPRRHVVRPR